MSYLKKSTYRLIIIIVLMLNCCYVCAQNDSEAYKETFRMWKLLFEDPASYVTTGDISYGCAYFEYLYPKSVGEEKETLNKWMSTFILKSISNNNLRECPNVNDNFVDIIRDTYGKDSGLYYLISFFATKPTKYVLNMNNKGNIDIRIVTNEKQEQYFKEFIGLYPIKHIVPLSALLLTNVHNLPYNMIEETYQKILTSDDIQEENYDYVFDQIVYLWQDHIFPSSKLATLDLTQPFAEQTELSYLYNMVRERTVRRFGVCSQQMVDLIYKLTIQFYLYDDKEMINSVYMVLDNPSSSTLIEENYNKVVNAGLKAFDRMVSKAEKWDYTQQSPLDLLKRKKSYLIKQYGRDSQKFKNFIITDVVSRFGEYSEEYDIIVNQ